MLSGFQEPAIEETDEMHVLLRTSLPALIFATICFLIAGQIPDAASEESTLAEGSALSDLPDPVFLSKCRDVSLSRGGGAEIELTAEYAVSVKDRGHGMMGRLSHPEGAAMLFDFPDTGRARFWMKNTPAPLDIAFFDESHNLVHLAEGRPFSEEVLSAPQGTFVKYGLELPAGDAAKYGLVVGKSRMTIGPVRECPRP